MEKKTEIELIKEKLQEKYFEDSVKELGEKVFEIKNDGVVHYRGLPSQNMEKFYLGMIQKLFKALAEEKTDRWLSENLKEYS